MTTAELLAIAALTTGLAIGAAIWWRSRNVTAAEIERRRRMLIHTEGRIIDAMVTDVQDNQLFFSYSISGVDYTASQDVTALSSLLPGNRETLVGPAACKYQRKNPANSIVICEEWSGFRITERTI